MATLEELATKGYENYKAKETQMKENYEAMLDTMVENYKKTPFGPKVKAHYEAAKERMRKHYRTDAEKWKTNWMKKMSL